MIGAVTDIVTIGGKQYSIDALLDRVLVAAGPVKIYNGSDFTKPLYVVNNGNSVGKIYSYLRPSSRTGGRFMFMFDHPTEKHPNGTPKSYYAGSDNIDTSVLAAQGTLTLEEQVKKEQEEKMKAESPIEYYISKYAGKVLLIGGLIYLASELGKQVIKQKV